jgi:two-component system LytT family response regulator
MIVKSQEKLIRDYVAIATIEEIYFIKMNEIIYCKSEGRYTNFYLQNGKISISSKNLGDYESRVLDKSSFFRIHNSFIINMRFLVRIIKTDGNSCEMENGAIIPISKRRLEEFNRYINLKE